jgi:cobalt-zinc-cadmium efflux system outer membrane protein
MAVALATWQQRAVAQQASPAAAASTEVEMRRQWAGLALALSACVWASSARGQESAALSLPADSLLAQLIAESLAARPEIAAAEAELAARGERVPQAGALPDPMLEVGIQNDGFDGLTIGEMEGSTLTLMASQTLPWPGKRGLRGEIAAFGVEDARIALGRAQLDTEVAVRRAYLELLLARERLALLARLERIWTQARAAVQARYEAGSGAQTELLRAQLELSRLAQRRWALLAAERLQVQGLNRLRGRPLAEPIPATGSLRRLALPSLPAAASAMEDALARSPELAAARLAIASAERERALAGKGYWPDLVLKAGLMPRGGDFEPMWTLSLGTTLPIFAGRKQSRAVAESQARTLAGRHEAAAIEQLLRLRVEERLGLLATLGETLRLYETGLLIQSEALIASAMEGYRAGQLGFSALADASAGYLADEDGYLATLAEAHRLAIAALEISLEPVAAPAVSLAGPGAGMAGMAAGAPAAGMGGRPAAGGTQDEPAAGAAAPMPGM